MMADLVIQQLFFFLCLYVPVTACYVSTANIPTRNHMGINDKVSFACIVPVLNGNDRSGPLVHLKLLKFAVSFV